MNKYYEVPKRIWIKRIREYIRNAQIYVVSKSREENFVEFSIVFFRAMQSTKSNTTIFLAQHLHVTFIPNV